MGDNKSKKEDRKGHGVARPPTGGSLAGSQPQEEANLLSFEKNTKGPNKGSPNVSLALLSRV